ncbi:hypothetical protein SKAU_G00015040 [Synaphobranchus kaupii]|uniref:Uncharacterized protein n=1 Tax=Synaphobranchus kaupii TaxID=118154 RepID=A0A9Q1JBL8_SYNKA|nr:hypothetical protein SKAU_G00015040 [Synaphobranchus kaupii]
MPGTQGDISRNSSQWLEKAHVLTNGGIVWGPFSWAWGTPGADRRRNKMTVPLMSCWLSETVRSFRHGTDRAWDSGLRH